MEALSDILRRTTTITLDCYGTLIDWQAGFARVFREVFGDVGAQREVALFDAYFQLEKEVEAGPYQPYREVLATTVRRIAERFGRSLSPSHADLAAETLPDWPVFADTVEALTLLKQRYRLGVLSNIDRDLFAGTARRLGVAFDFVITAEDVRSYKPAHGHFQRLIADYAARETVLHVAQSLYHDGVPVRQLGLAFVWINRYGDVNRTQVQPLAEFADLASFAEAARRSGSARRPLRLSGKTRPTTCNPRSSEGTH